MPYLTFGDVQRRATQVGLVMSRKGIGIHLRYRDPQISAQTWSNLNAAEASEIVAAVHRQTETGNVTTLSPRWQEGRLEQPAGNALTTKSSAMPPGQQPASRSVGCHSE